MIDNNAVAPWGSHGTSGGLNAISSHLGRYEYQGPSRAARPITRAAPLSRRLSIWRKKCPG